MGIYQNLETLESNLYNAKKSLANTLVGKGVDSNAENETLTQLIGKIDDIQTGGENPFEAIGYENKPSHIQDDIDFSLSYMKNFNTNQTKFKCDRRMVYFPLVDTSKITDMSSTFSTCYMLRSVPPINTSNVTNMHQMFSNCSGLTSLDLSSFDTSKVTSMGNMFDSCWQLTSLDLSSFDTSNVTSMREMFRNCSGLTSLDLTHFNISNVTAVTESNNANCGMFSGMFSLSELKLPQNFITSKITLLRSMFENCRSLISLDLSDWDTSNVTSMEYMFNGCYVKSLDLSGWDTSKVTNMNRMFYNCSGLTELDLSSFDTSKVTSMGSMFSGCTSLISLILNDFDTSNITSTNINDMFMKCSGLTEIHWNNFGNGSYTAVTFISSSKLGVNTTDYPNARQSLINMLATNSFDRATNGYSTCTVTLSSKTKTVLTSDEIAQITAKGFTVA